MCAIQPIHWRLDFAFLPLLTPCSSMCLCQQKQGVHLSPSSSRMGCLWFEDTPTTPRMRISCCSLIPAASSLLSLQVCSGPSTWTRSQSPSQPSHSQRTLSNLPAKLLEGHSSPISTGTKCHLGPTPHPERLVCIILSGSEFETQVSPKRNISSTPTKTPACCWCTSWTTKSAGGTTAHVGLRPQPFP